jgi:hypothetical protein
VARGDMPSEVRVAAGGLGQLDQVALEAGATWTPGAAAARPRTLSAVTRADVVEGVVVAVGVEDLELGVAVG